MKCTIPGLNAKMFAKAFQCLAKSGDVLYIEALPEGLSLRTINATTTAYLKILFTPSFFSAYKNSQETEGEECNSCRLSMKSCIQVFRNVKSIDLCKIRLDTENSKLIFELKCKSETVKNHYVRILEYQSLRPVNSTDVILNRITGSQKVFNDIVNNFQANEEEITVITSPNMITVQNYMTRSTSNPRSMKSHFQIQAHQFQEYIIEEHTSLTYCLRELRALLNFAEALNLTVDFIFETTGKPVTFVLKNSDTFESTLIMSTQGPIDDSNSVAISQTSNISLTKKTENKKNIGGRKRNPDTRSKRQKTDLFNDEELFNFVPDTNADKVRCMHSNLETPISLQMEVSTISKKQEQSVQMAESDDMQVIFQENTEDEEMIPPSPIRNPRTRFIFRRCFEPTFDPNSLPGSSQVWAENSDSEDSLF